MPELQARSRRTTSVNGRPIPVLLLGGQENTLAIVRSLAGHGIPVSVSAPASCWALRSRHCAGRYVIPAGADSKAFWERLLLSNAHPELKGAVLFPCSDDAIEFVAGRRTDLAQHYLMDDQIASQQLALLDKQETLRLASSLGIATPKQWTVSSVSEIDAIEAEIQFPVLIKPIHSHLFQRVFPNKKLLVIENGDELRSKMREVLGHGLEVMVCELIPGPDDLLSSYYTYIDREGNHLFHFTKRVIRRSPPSFGAGAYHITEWLPETADLGKRFFRGIGFRGLGNIEFKRDPRDGRLKVIEVNARFTAAQELLVRANMDIAWIIYAHVTGAAVPRTNGFTEHLRLWNFLSDFDAFRALRARGELSFLAWVRSIAHRQVVPYFAFGDPLPAVARGWNTFRTRILRRQPA